MDVIDKIYKGVVSGVTAGTICWPLDTIKTQNQVRLRGKSLIQSFRFIIKNDGFMGLYRGLLSGNLATGVFYGAFLPIYEINKSFFKKYVTNEHILNGMSSYLAGIIASTLDNPLYVLKTRYQAALVKGTQSQVSLFKMAYNMYKREGLSVFMKGLGVSYFKNLELGVQLILFEKLKKYLNTDKNKFVALPIASFLAKTIASTVTYPIDTIRTICRTDSHIGIRNITTNVYKSGGLVGFYKGYSAYFIRAIPSSVIVFTINECLKCSK